MKHLAKTLMIAAAALLAAGNMNLLFAIDGTAMVTGGEVQYFGVSEVQWLNGTELLIKYTGEGSFILPGLSKARILAVGGGGGAVATRATTPGGSGYQGVVYVNNY